MAVNLVPYLTFDNRAREVMEFYRSVFGGQLDVTEFGAFGTPSSPDDAGKVMHSALVTAAGPTIFASDAGAEHGVPAPVSSVSLTLTGGPEDEPTLRGYFDALAVGGTVTVPLDVAPWGDTFGMLTDRFGVDWMVSVGPA